MWQNQGTRDKYDRISWTEQNNLYSGIAPSFYCFVKAELALTASVWDGWAKVTEMGRHFSADCLGWWTLAGQRRVGVWKSVGTEVCVWLESISQPCRSEMHFFHRTRGYPLPRHTNNKTVTHQSECQVINLHWGIYL